MVSIVLLGPISVKLVENKKKRLKATRRSRRKACTDREKGIPRILDGGAVAVWAATVANFISSLECVHISSVCIHHRNIVNNIFVVVVVNCEVKSETNQIRAKREILDRARKSVFNK